MLYNDMSELIGNTPLVKLIRSGFPPGVNVYAKLELYNPGGSVKDRIGKFMIEDAVRRGVLKQGGTIIEGTAGNTGLGIAFAALGMGYRLIMVVPTKFSVEKQALLRALGAEVVNTPQEDGMLGAEAKARELRESIPNSVAFEQFRNPANVSAHYETTGAEIWRDLQSAGITPDYLVAGAGSGGTFTGIMRYIRERHAGIKGILADPAGSTIGAGLPGGSDEHFAYDIEGIGNDFVADTMDVSLVDRVIRVRDSDAFEQAQRLAKTEGIIAGSSSGAAYYAAQKLANELAESVKDGPENVNIVVVFPDRGERYFSKNLYV